MRSAEPGISLASKRARGRIADQIHERISVAILERRLPPGAKLTEERLAEIFCVSRSRIREVLSRLAREQIIELIPQRGAYVARPSLERTREILEARRLIEPAVLRRLIDTITPAKMHRLRQHNALEQDARRRGDTRAVIRLSGQFHVLAAELAGNSAFTRSMRELSMLTALTVLIDAVPAAGNCRKDEHEHIVEGVARRDHASVERLIQLHLDHIEEGLNVEPHHR